MKASAMHGAAAGAHAAAQKMRETAEIAAERMNRGEPSIFTMAYAEAKHREAAAAVRSATAQSIWASWTMKVRP